MQNMFRCIGIYGIIAGNSFLIVPLVCVIEKHIEKRIKREKVIYAVDRFVVLSAIIFYRIDIKTIVLSPRELMKKKGVQDAVKNRVRITINGKSFTLMGQESEEQIKQVADYIEQKIQEIRLTSKAVALDSSLAYVLTAINVADDYFKEVEKNICLEGDIENLRLEEIAAQAEKEKQTEQIRQLQQEKTKIEEAQKTKINQKDSEISR